MADQKAKGNFLTEKLDNLRLQQKLWLIQIFCVLLPLLLTDSVILTLIFNEEKRATQQEMDNIADSVKYMVNDSVQSAVGIMQNIYGNRYVDEFIKSEFASPEDYYDQYVDFIRDSLYAVGSRNGQYNAVIYADNAGIVNGGYFHRLETVEDTQWYQELEESGRDVIIFSDYVNTGANNQRVISLVRRMDYYHKGYDKSVLKVDLDYRGISGTILNANYFTTLYVCEGDRILFSNDGRGGLQAPFEILDMQYAAEAGVHDTLNIYGKTWDVYVMTPDIDSWGVIRANFPLIGGLICANFILPFLFMRLINRSFIQRIREMDSIFRNVDGDELKQLPKVRGNDEISALMVSYNKMAQRMNELIETEYKNRLRSQEIDIARQNAELLALHSQINPHFLFNALESIRMHSVLKKEFETADMVQKLAMMERQNVEWGGDLVRIGEEIEFVEAYLELQKYRFGPKLSYEINVDEECSDYMLPKLSLVTFVENACVHGMENKTLASWIFVRISILDEMLVMEVEDTGSGMAEEQCKNLLKEMETVTIEMLKENRHVGILNAALRLKMATENRVLFEMDSETGAGTMVTIRVPLEQLERSNV